MPGQPTEIGTDEIDLLLGIDHQGDVARWFLDVRWEIEDPQSIADRLKECWYFQIDSSGVATVTERGQRALEAAEHDA